MKLDQILTEAAEIYANKRHSRAKTGCCNAIGGVEFPHLYSGSYEANTEAQVFFSGIYGGAEQIVGVGWFWAAPLAKGFEADRCPRVLALLFAAEVARTGL